MTNVDSCEPVMPIQDAPQKAVSPEAAMHLTDYHEEYDMPELGEVGFANVLRGVRRHQILRSAAARCGKLVSVYTYDVELPDSAAKRHVSHSDQLVSYDCHALSA